jgi:uncharacterized Tic20 family protein
MSEAQEPANVEPIPVQASPLSRGEEKIPSIDIQALPIIPPTPPPQPVPEPVLRASQVEPAPPMSPPPPAAPPPPTTQAPSSATPAPEAPRKTVVTHGWAMLCHLLLFLVIPTVFLGGVITFFVWQWKGTNDKQVEDQGREALNFQINVAVLTLLLSFSCFLAVLVPVVWLVALIMCIIAARHAYRGETYRYPWVLRVVAH